MQGRGFYQGKLNGSSGQVKMMQRILFLLLRWYNQFPIGHTETVPYLEYIHDCSFTTTHKWIRKKSQKKPKFQPSQTWAHDHPGEEPNSISLHTGSHLWVPLILEALLFKWIAISCKHFFFASSIPPKKSVRKDSFSYVHCCIYPRLSHQEQITAGVSNYI